MKKKWKAIVAIIIVIVFAFVAIVPMALQMNASATGDVAAKREQLSAISDQKKKLQEEMDSVKRDKNQQMVYKDKLAEEITLTQQEIDTLNSLINDLDAQIVNKQAEIDQLQAQLDRQMQYFKLRVRTMYEDGESSYIEVLLASESYYAFLTRLEVISSIMERDNKIIDDMKATNEALKLAKTELETSLKETEDAKAQVVEKQKDLEAKMAESQAIIDKLAADEAYIKEQYLIAEKQMNNVQAEIDRILEEQRKEQERLKQAQSVYVGGSFTWPCPGYSTITSEFGMRFHPVLKVNKLHTGTDIAAPYGAKIVAANAGTVITSTFNAAYGNYVVVDHGGGTTTLYAHMSSRSVSKGQTVTKGQQIGLVGSTGYSTGNHLHFEVRINGSLVNPMGYF